MLGKEIIGMPCLSLKTLLVQEPAAAASSSNGSAPEEGEEESFDLSLDKHKGQFALRKLYHASDRLIAVLYTSPSCGPCRSLKPILNGVIDEYKGQVHYVEIVSKTADSPQARAPAASSTRCSVTSVPCMHDVRP